MIFSSGDTAQYQASSLCAAICTYNLCWCLCPFVIDDCYVLLLGDVNREMNIFDFAAARLAVCDHVDLVVGA